MIALLGRLQRLILKYPFAAQALFSALVAEGRRFAQTKEGERLRAEIAQSELLERCQTVFQFVTHNVLEERAPDGLPSALLDAFIDVARRADLESLLRRFLANEEP
ncbi:hypothetical protein WMF45_50900 [Sorangium sp. So ce448]|uniref:hypothetical protein n=1 Tax=Sorangium sp. So ce448 TaxID=3133314 RepID=UPI003F61BDF4